jgi:hypothetical protein
LGELGTLGLGTLKYKNTDNPRLNAISSYATSDVHSFKKAKKLGGVITILSVRRIFHCGNKSAVRRMWRENNAGR